MKLQVDYNVCAFHLVISRALIVRHVINLGAVGAVKLSHQSQMGQPINFVIH